MAVLTKNQQGVAERKPTKNGALRVKKYNRREAVAGYLFISPWIIGFLVFTLGAMIYSLVISFSYLSFRER